MTITVLPARNEYTATASQTVFNYTFKIFSNADLNVYITPTGQEADDATDLTTAYTVDVATIGDAAGGFLTLDVGTTAGYLVTIVSNVAESRTTDYQFNGDFIPATVNDDFDRVVQLTKQVEDRSGRTLAFQESLQGATSLILPNPQATYFMRWRADELGLENVDLTTFGMPTDSSVITYDPPFTGSQSTTVENKLSESVSAKDFGVSVDGATDDATIINSSLTTIGTDRTYHLPAGEYAVTTDIIQNGGQLLQGDGGGGTNINTGTGSVIKAVSGGTFTDAMIKQSASSRIEGVKFDGNSVAATAVKFKSALNGFQPVLTSCRFDDFTGITVTNTVDGAVGADSASISFCEFNGGGTGFIAMDAASDTDIYENRFIPDLNVSYCVQITSTVNNSIGTVSRNLFEGSNAGVGVSGFVDGVIIDADRITVDSNNFQVDPADTNHLSHIRVKSGAGATVIRENNFQSTGVNAKNVRVESGAFGTHIYDSIFGWTIANGATDDIEDLGTNTLIEYATSTAGELFSLFSKRVFGAIGGGKAIEFDTTSAAAKISFSPEVSVNNWLGLISGILEMSSNSNMRVRSKTGSVSLYANDVLAAQFTDTAVAGEMKALLVTDSGAVKRVKYGAVDSGGAGQRLLTIDN